MARAFALLSRSGAVKTSARRWDRGGLTVRRFRAGSVDGENARGGHGVHRRVWHRITSQRQTFCYSSWQLPMCCSCMRCACTSGKWHNICPRLTSFVQGGVNGVLKLLVVILAADVPLSALNTPALCCSLPPQHAVSPAVSVQGGVNGVLKLFAVILAADVLLFAYEYITAMQNGSL